VAERGLVFAAFEDAAKADDADADEQADDAEDEEHLDEGEARGGLMTYDF
jgi:hypothetical protein